MLDLKIDPKLAWALANRAMFPVDINTAARETLLRVPGLGAKGVGHIIETRRYHGLRLDDVKRMASSVRNLLPWIVTVDWRPRSMLDADNLEARLRAPAQQLELFAA